MRAATRAHSRLVSTNSAAITHFGGFFVRVDPLAITNLALRAPMNSRSDVVRIPIWLRRPASRER